MIGIIEKRTLLLLCPLNIIPILSGMCYYCRHYIDEKTEAQRASLLPPLSHSHSGGKPEVFITVNHTCVLNHYTMLVFRKTTVLDLDFT